MPRKSNVALKCNRAGGISAENRRRKKARTEMYAALNQEVIDNAVNDQQQSHQEDDDYNDEYERTAWAAVTPDDRIPFDYCIDGEDDSIFKATKLLCQILLFPTT